MLKQILEGVTNRDVMKEIAKTVDTVTAMKADGNELIVNGTKNGDKINFTLSGKVSNYNKFADLFKKSKDLVNKEIKKHSK